MAAGTHERGARRQPGRGTRRRSALAVAFVLVVLGSASSCGDGASAGAVAPPAEPPSAGAAPDPVADSTPTRGNPPAPTPEPPPEPASAAKPAPPEPASAAEPAPAPTTVPVTAPEPTEPILPSTVTDETGGTITVESIERIIPLDGDVAEVVFALGLGAHVVATDLSATYPPEADALPEIGYQRALSAEAVAAFAPTVLLATDIAGPPEALDDMRRLGFPLVIIPNESTSVGAGRKIRAVAAALGVPRRGESLAQEVDDAIAAAAVEPDAVEDSLRVIALYLRGTAAQLMLGESSNTRWLIEAAGGIDVSAAMGITDPVPISAEAILAAAPQVVLVPEAGLTSVNGIDGLLEIGGIGETPAGRDRRVLAYDDQLLLGNGPRTAEMLARLRDDLDGFATHPEGGPDE